MIIIQKASYMGFPDGRAVAFEADEEPDRIDGIFQWAYATLRSAREDGWEIRDDLEVIEAD